MLNEDFLARMKEYLKEEYQAFLDSYNEPNIRSFRVNERYISTEKFESIFDYPFKKIPYMSNGYYLLQDDLKLGFHPLHHAGAIYMQDPSAMIPAEVVDIPTDAFVLDLCASPGGKSGQLALKVSDGVLVSNEIDFTRCKTLYSNIERLGLSNVIVTNNDSKDFLKDFKNSFDVILVDAPCSGEGMFRKYPESQSLWSLENVMVCHNRDKEILDNVHQLLKKGGILIYSTCTFAIEENEDIIKYMLDTYNYEQVDIKDKFKPFLKEGFIPKTYRFYPHIASGEGQFVAVLRKLDGEFNEPRRIKKYQRSVEFDDFKKKNLNTDITNIIQKKDDLYLCASPYDFSSLKVLNYGVRLGEVSNKRFIPNHNFYKALPELFKSNCDVEFNTDVVTKYLHGEQVTINTLDGFGVFKVNGISLGGYKAKNDVLNNHYPKGLRNF